MRLHPPVGELLAIDGCWGWGATFSQGVACVTVGSTNPIPWVIKTNKQNREEDTVGRVWECSGSSDLIHDIYVAKLSKAKLEIFC